MINTDYSSPVRSVKAKAELYNGSALVATYTDGDKIKSIEIQRVSEGSKFFGFGICKRLNIKLIDVNRSITITTANSIVVSFGINNAFDRFATFYVTEVNRDENTNELSITAYDKINSASEHTVSELEITNPSTIADYASACASLLGVNVVLGKNNIKYPYSQGSSRTTNGITFVANEDGTVTANGTATANAFFSLTNNLNLIAGERYILSGCPAGGALSTYYLNIENYEATSTYCRDVGEGVAFTATDLMKRVYVVIKQGATVNNVVFRPMIELGDTKTGYEKYTTAIDTSYPEGANFDGSETIRTCLDMIAEATQTVYYLTKNNVLNFKSLDKDGNEALTIDKEKYFSLKSGANRRLQTIVSATELGDNVSESTSLVGSTQYCKDNAFWNLRDDIATLVHNALLKVGDMTIGAFNATWRGNPSLQIGDKIKLINKDNSVSYSYILDDVITYDGTFSQQTKWKFEGSGETDSNPTSIGDALRHTSAKVDKVNQKINMLVETDDSLTGQIAQLVMDTGKIQLSVEDKSKQINDLSNNLNTLTENVNASVKKDSLAIEVNKILSNGVDSVTTSTGFTFDEKGLTVSKSSSSLSTTVDEDGVDIKDNGIQVFNADSNGVDARNLHATTYLIIGKDKGRSRFEDIGTDRTGCFWIG